MIFNVEIKDILFTYNGSNDTSSLIKFNFASYKKFRFKTSNPNNSARFIFETVYPQLLNSKILIIKCYKIISTILGYKKLLHTIQLDLLTVATGSTKYKFNLPGSHKDYELHFTCIFTQFCADLLLSVDKPVNLHNTDATSECKIMHSPMEIKIIPMEIKISATVLELEKMYLLTSGKKIPLMMNYNPSNLGKFVTMDPLNVRISNGPVYRQLENSLSSNDGILYGSAVANYPLESKCAAKCILGIFDPTIPIHNKRPSANLKELKELLYEYYNDLILEEINGKKQLDLKTRLDNSIRVLELYHSAG